MEQILIVEDDSFLNKMLDYNLTADGKPSKSPFYCVTNPQQKE